MIIRGSDDCDGRCGVLRQGMKEEWLRSCLSGGQGTSVKSGQELIGSDSIIPPHPIPTMVSYLIALG